MVAGRQVAQPLGVRQFRYSNTAGIVSRCWSRIAWRTLSWGWSVQPQTALVFSETNLNPGQVLERSFQIYAGPKEYLPLSRMDNRIDLVMDYTGFSGPFAKLLLVMMNFLHNSLHLTFANGRTIIVQVGALSSGVLTQALLHGLKQRALNLGGCTVDLVHEHDVAEQWSRPEFEGGGARVEHAGADEVAGHQVRGELHARELQAEGARQGVRQGGFADARNVLDQKVATGEQASDAVLDL